MKKKSVSLVILALGICSSVSAFQFHPSLSLLGSSTITTNNTTMQSGLFDVMNRSTNFGFEFTNKFPITNDYFIRTGIRRNTYRTVIAGKNLLPTVVAYYPLIWDRRHASLTVPVQLGKDFTTRDGHKGDFYIGGSAGVRMLSSAKTMVSGGYSAFNNNTDTITTSIIDNSDQSPTDFFATADAGFNYKPFKANSRFTLGAFCSVQLTQSSPNAFHGTVRNGTTGTEYRYDVRHSERVINCTVMLSYSFGKHRSEPAPSLLEQP